MFVFAIPDCKSSEDRINKFRLKSVGLDFDREINAVVTEKSV